MTGSPAGAVVTGAARPDVWINNAGVLVTGPAREQHEPAQGRRTQRRLLARQVRDGADHGGAGSGPRPPGTRT